MSATSRDVREIVREEPLMRRRILEVLAEGPRTVPEVAAAIDAPSDEVMFWMMGMRKYGYLVEQELTDDGYYRYRAVERRGS